MTERILLVVCAIVAVLLLPWWLWIGIALVGIVRHPWFFEAAAVGFIADTFYRGDIIVPWPFTLCMVVCVLGAALLRERLRTYETT